LPFFVKFGSQFKKFTDTDVSIIAKNTLLKKAKIANINLREFNLQFIDFCKTKLIKIHDISNKCFVSKVKITGNETVKNFACKAGIGNCTGAGFGFIY
jgi:CRISPR/Cas system endoribonuclease Cas6 (RAMP superfamily)